MRGRAFSLLSGGLDSILATRLVMGQGIEVTGLHFITPFFGYGIKGKEREFAERCHRLYAIDVRVIDVSQEYFQVVRHPRYGYGKNFNPCIDCKIFLFAKAKALLHEEKRDFLITGEVLGQRPMSQRRDTLRVVERDSGTDGLLLRPLCAKHLKPTQAELDGLVNRDKLLDFSGRSRKPQMRLAAELGIREYPAPAGGCLLTDPILAGRIRKFFTQSPDIAVEDIELLKVGRHFQFSPGLRLVIGRTEEENKRILELRREGDTFVKLRSLPGPLGLLRGPAGVEESGLAGAIIARYSKARGWEEVEVQIGADGENFSDSVHVAPAKDDLVQSLKI